MGRRKKEDIQNNISNQELITLTHYLSNYNDKRVLDKTITNWFRRNNTNFQVKKTVNEWDDIISIFLNEKER